MPGTFGVPERRPELLPPANDQRRERDAVAHVEHPHALWAIELVGGKREQVDAERLHVERQPERRGDGIGVKEHAVPASDRGQPRDGFDRAHLVVRVHERCQNRRGAERPLEYRGIDAALAVDGQQRNLDAAGAQAFERRQHRVVLDAGGDHVCRPRRRRDDAEQRQIIRLGTAGSEHDLRASYADCGGDAIARVVQYGARATAFGV